MHSCDYFNIPICFQNRCAAGMKKLLLLFLLLLLFKQSDSYAQNPIKLWQIQFDYGGDWDDARNLIINNDGNYLVTGFNEPRNSPNLTAAMTKFDRDGNLIWQWISEEDTTWTASSGIAYISGQNQFYLTIGRWPGKSASLLKFSDEGQLLEEKIFGSQNQMLVATNSRIGAVVNLKSSPTAHLFDFQGDSIRSFSVGEFATNSTLVLDDQYLYFFGIDFNSQGDWNSSAFARRFDFQGNMSWSKHFDDAFQSTGAVDDSGNVYFGIGKFEGIDQIFLTVKYDKDGNEIWRRQWDGNPISGTRLVNWLQDIIVYPGGGCLLVGSLAQNGNQPSENLTDFGAIAYDGDGDTRWTLRFQAHNNWERNDLWAIAWDNEKHLVLLGSAFKKWDIPPDDHRYLILTKWYVPGVTVGIEEETETAASFHLLQNYPNPFNPTTTIEYTLPNAGDVSLKVYNLTGREVAFLVNGAMPAGNHRVT